MTTIAASLTASILTLSIGLYFGVLLALSGLLILAGSAGQWNLARAWCPALFEHLGIVFVLIALASQTNDLTIVGLALIAMGLVSGRQGGAILNPSIESAMLFSALASLSAVLLTYSLV